MDVGVMFGEPVAVLDSSSAGADSSGEPIPGAGTSTTYDGCAVWPLTSEEVLQIGGNPVVTHNSIAFPADALVRPSSQLVIREEIFQVVGAPDVWVNPYTGARPGIVVIARRVTTDGA